MSNSDKSVVSRLRKLIGEGAYQPGERLGEVAVSEQLGVSRTPVRLAFRTLEQEGLLQRAGKRGFMVREFTEADVLCAVEVRGVLEGLAARRLAEQGLSPALDAKLEVWIQKGRELLAKGYLEERDVDVWSELNRHFHETIVGSSGSPVIGDAIARNNHLPFAAADSIVIDSEALDREYRKLQLAQVQHELVVQALRHGEGARAEMLMREHAFIGLRYGELFGLGG
ncbi:MAG: GntR family transcriptional regulator [Halomonas sp.]|uniref:GntR family transcriptional regulator n=1 Tax=Billgrantia antri TaxID=2846777 RepID=A0ABS6ZT75_9GAMM|nr:GntR family transcriptional regulator [Halomonas antri]MDX5378097.1 GntR family transcriptional regulator [Halomonas sp.]MDX5503420.1 GntR family transcriptional regulator [Halomonas sp.]